MQEKPKIEQQYLNDFHKKNSEASMKEVAQLSKRGYTWEEMHEQTKRKTKGKIGRPWKPYTSQFLVLRINICGENYHLRQARKHYSL